MLKTPLETLEELEELKLELLEVNEYEIIDHEDNNNQQLEKKIEIYTSICNKLLIIMFEPSETITADRILYGQSDAKIILAELLALKENTKNEESKNKLLGLEQLLRLCSGEINEATLQALNEFEPNSLNKTTKPDKNTEYKNSFLLGYGRYIAAAAVTAFIVYNTSTFSPG